MAVFATVVSVGACTESTPDATGDAAAGASGGGSGGGDGGGGGTGPSTCENCQPFDIGGLTYLAACCRDQLLCGVTVNENLTESIGVPPGCYPVKQPGKLDPSCPPFLYTKPYDAGVGSWPGCCTWGSGKCGALVDLTETYWINFGCLELGGGGSGSQKCGGPIPDAGVDALDTDGDANGVEDGDSGTPPDAAVE